MYKKTVSLNDFYNKPQTKDFIIKFLDHYAKRWEELKYNGHCLTLHNVCSELDMTCNSIEDDMIITFYAPLRTIKVFYSGGYIITTDMAAHLSDEDMLDYFKIGRLFNIGSNNDNIQSVIKTEIIK